MTITSFVAVHKSFDSFRIVKWHKALSAAAARWAVGPAPADCRQNAGKCRQSDSPRGGSCLPSCTGAIPEADCGPTSLDRCADVSADGRFAVHAVKNLRKCSITRSGASSCRSGRSEAVAHRRDCSRTCATPWDISGSAALILGSPSPAFSSSEPVEQIAAARTPSVHCGTTRAGSPAGCHSL